MKEQTAYLWKEWTLNREMFVLLNTTSFSVKH